MRRRAYRTCGSARGAWVPVISARGRRCSSVKGVYNQREPVRTRRRCASSCCRVRRATPSAGTQVGEVGVPELVVTKDESASSLQSRECSTPPANPGGVLLRHVRGHGDRGIGHDEQLYASLNRVPVMPWDTRSSIRCSGMQPVVCGALAALACLALASCGGGPGAVLPDPAVEAPAVSDPRPVVDTEAASPRPDLVVGDLAVSDDGPTAGGLGELHVLGHGAQRRARRGGSDDDRSLTGRKTTPSRPPTSRWAPPRCRSWRPRSAALRRWS